MNADELASCSLCSTIWRPESQFEGREGAESPLGASFGAAASPEVSTTSKSAWLASETERLGPDRYDGTGVYLASLEVVSPEYFRGAPGGWVAPGGRGAYPDMLLAECKTGRLCSRQLSRSSCLYGLVCCTRCSTRATCFFPALGTSGHSSEDKFVWSKKKIPLVRVSVSLCVPSLCASSFRVYPCASVLIFQRTLRITYAQVCPRRCTPRHRNREAAVPDRKVQRIILRRALRPLRSQNLPMRRTDIQALWLRTRRKMTFRRLLPR